MTPAEFIEQVQAYETTYGFIPARAAMNSKTRRELLAQTRVFKRELALPQLAFDGKIYAYAVTIADVQIVIHAELADEEVEML